MLCHQQPVGMRVYVRRIYWCFNYKNITEVVSISRFSPKQIVFYHKIKMFILCLLSDSTSDVLV